MDPVEAGDWLHTRPLLLVLLTGLDPVNKTGHAALLNALLTRTPDRPPLNLRTVDGELALPPKVSKRPERGVLRKDWPTKYTQRVPALIVVFVALEWDDPSWNERKSEVESKVKSVRAAASRCGSRVALVLLQDRSLPHSDENATIRASELCTQCELSAKQLFKLPTSGDLQGYVSKLETALHEIAQGFYQQKIKTIRGRAIPNNSTPLVVRQQFKLGLLSELKQDTHTALRNYRIAYDHCRDNQDGWEQSDVFEWRSVAGLLNYKICDLCFLHSTALEAIAQMKKHVASFFYCNPGVYPTQQLASIEYELWKSKQCWHFAELFERAIMHGLTAVATQNPGAHLDSAASFYSRANTEIASLKTSIGSSPPPPLSTDPLSAIPTFFGQRPWRVGVDGLAPQNVERDAVMALQSGLRVNHEGVLALLASAMSQYKKYGCYNMQRKIQAEMADEYALNGEWPKALQYLQLVTREALPLTVRQLITGKAVGAAWMAADVKAYVGCVAGALATEYALTSSTNCSPSEKSVHLMHGLTEILSSRPPPPPLDPPVSSPSLLASSSSAWLHALSQPTFFTIAAPPPARRVPCLVSISACFLPLNRPDDIPSPSSSIPSPSTSSTFSAIMRADAKVPVRVSLSLNSSLPMQFARLRVGVDVGGKRRAPEERSQWELTTDQVTLQPGKQKVFTFVVDLSEQELPEGCNVVISRVYLEVGSDRSRMAGVLEWDGGGLALGLDGGFAGIRIASRGAVIQNEGVKSVEVLTAEVVSVPLILRSLSQNPLRNVRLEFKRPPPSTSSVGMAMLFLDERQQLQADLAALVATEIAPGEKVDFTLKMSAQMVGHIEQLPIEVTFDSQSGRDSCLIPIAVTSKEPFAVVSSILNINGVPVQSLLCHNTHVLKVDVRASAAIVVTKVEWLLADILSQHDHPSETAKIEDDLEEGDIVSYCTVVDVRPQSTIGSEISSTSSSSSTCSSGDSSVLSSVPPAIPPPPIGMEKPLGRVCIEWKRRTSPFAAVRSVIPLISCQLHPCPISLSASLFPSATAPSPERPLNMIDSADGCHEAFPWKPSNRCMVGAPIGVEYRVTSHHHEMVRLNVSVEIPDSFLFAGARQSGITLLPGTTVPLRIVIMAQAAGRLPFPRLLLKSATVADGLLADSNRALPANIFVLPMAKEGRREQGTSEA